MPEEFKLIDAEESNRLAQARRVTVLNHLEELFEATRNGNIKALRTLQDIARGSKKLWESQTTADFPALTSELMGRQLRAQFMAWPTIFRQIVPVRPTPLLNFKNVYSVKVERLNNSATFGTKIPEGASFGRSNFQDSSEGYQAYKYIEGYKAAFELRLNDDLGGLGQIPQLMVEDAVYVQEKFCVGLFADANGPHASLYTTGRGNIVTDGSNVNLPLSISALQYAWGQLKSAKSAGTARPINVGANGVTLVVGNARLEAIAYQIKNTMEIRQTEGSDTRVSTPYLPNLTIVYNPFIGEVVSSNLATSWWLFPTPTPNPTRTWAEVGFLAGMEVPQLFMKAPNTLRSDGSVASDIGDFDTWATEYAVATAFGGRQLDDYQVTVASKGTNAP
jgi:hypothetical protein